MRSDWFFLLIFSNDILLFLLLWFVSLIDPAKFLWINFNGDPSDVLKCFCYFGLSESPIKPSEGGFNALGLLLGSVREFFLCTLNYFVVSNSDNPKFDLYLLSFLLVLKNKGSFWVGDSGLCPETRFYFFLFFFLFWSDSKSYNLFASSIENK